VRSEKGVIISQEKVRLDLEDLEAKIRSLQEELAEKTQTLEAIQSGEVDAIVVSTEEGEQVFTLKGAEEPYRILFEQMNEGALTISWDLGILYCNQSFAESMKTPMERIIGANMEIFIHPSKRSVFKKMLKQSANGPVRDDLVFESSDGSQVPMQLSINHLWMTGSETYCIVATDLTERIRTQEALRRANDELDKRVRERTKELGESESKYRGMFEAVQEVFYIDRPIYDQEGNIIDWVFEDMNTAGSDFLGLRSAEEGRGKRGSEVLGQDIIPFYLPMMEEVWRSGKAIKYQYTSPYADREILASYVASGERIMIAQMDITDIKKVQKDLEINAKKLQRSNVELQQFAYVASHDMQEPLRMVISYLTLLDRYYRGRLDQDAQDFIKYAMDGGKRMKELIDDLLAYSRVDTVVKEFTLVEMNDLVEKTIELLKLPIEESGAIISIDPLPSIFADESQIGQVIQNLVSNAIKFRREKCPEVQISASEGKEFWTFAVKDNGIGLKMEYSDKIFQMFQRLQNGDEFQGSGVGLAITKKIVERHGGRIWVESEEGKGTTFFFTIPKVAPA
jgi:PAS domain S-box-containing protein